LYDFFSFFINISLASLTTTQYPVTVYKTHSLLAVLAFDKTFLKKGNLTMDENMNPTK
jgi:hypothetical protein